MSEERLLSIDIEPKADKPLWAHSDNAFRFNFLPENSPALQPNDTSPTANGTEPGRSQISFTRDDSAFAFNFQIPPVASVEAMETTGTSGSRAQEEKPSPPQEVKSPPETSVQTKGKKKKKKSGNKPPSDSTKTQETANSAEGSQGGDDSELSAEEQLNRQLDWCIEQLELGMKSQKGTPKQKEEASRALKTLRSSKAPLAKKRQVMRAMTGDYRKKIEEEKKKQHKLIQSEMASAKVKVVSDSPKKCVFHRRAGMKSTEGNLQQPEAQDAEQTSQAQEEAFVFTPSKDEFRFNFL